MKPDLLPFREDIVPILDYTALLDTTVIGGLQQPEIAQMPGSGKLLSTTEMFIEILLIKGMVFLSVVSGINRLLEFSYSPPGSTF